MSSEDSGRGDAIRQAREWIEIGNNERSRGASGLEASLAAYDRAVDLVSPLCDSETSPYRDALASAWINKGIALMNHGSVEALKRSIPCFDKAIELRTTLVGLDDPWFRYNLIGVWINRGDALARLGDAASRASALASYDEALRLGAGMETDPRPKVSWRLALAHVNRGALLVLMGQESGFPEAHRAFDSAIALLGDGSDSQRLIAAYAWEGKAEVLGRRGSEAEARDCARRSLAFVAGIESSAIDAAVVGLKARVALCANSRSLLARAGTTAAERNEVLEALDAADEGLRLAYAWPETRLLWPLIVELFRFASLGYAALQPQFLEEFIGDFMKSGASPELTSALRPLAIHAVRGAVGRLADAGLQRAGLKETEIALFGELRRTLEDLEKGRRPQATGVNIP